jgi:hypothetical protein
MLFIHIEEVLKSFGVTNYTIVGEPTTQEELFNQIKIVIGKDETDTVIYEKNVDNYPFTFDEFHEKLQEIKQDHLNKAYQRVREKEYPPIEEQLDMLWHAIDSGQLDQNSEFYKALKSVKDANPKIGN